MRKLKTIYRDKAPCGFPKIEIYPFMGDEDYYLASCNGKTWYIINNFCEKEKEFDNLVDAMEEILTYT